MTDLSGCPADSMATTLQPIPFVCASTGPPEQPKGMTGAPSLELPPPQVVCPLRYRSRLMQEGAVEYPLTIHSSVVRLRL